MTNDYEFNFNVNIQDDFSSSIGKDKGLSSALTKDETDIQKSEKAKRLSTGITGQVMMNTLMVFPELAIGAGIGLVSFLIDLGKKLISSIFGDGTDEDDTDTSEPSFDGIGSPLADSDTDDITGDGGISSSTVTFDELDPATGEPIDMSSKVLYDIDVNYTDNTSAVIKNFGEVNDTPINEAVDAWASTFETAAAKEKAIVENELTLPFTALNTVLKNVKSNKAEVDRLEASIKSMEKKIDKKKDEDKEDTSSNVSAFGDTYGTRTLTTSVSPVYRTQTKVDASSYSTFSQTQTTTDSFWAAIARG